jgi:hypothetical protein
MSSSVPAGQTDLDDWFDLDKYRDAAGVAYEFSKKKLEDAGEQERRTIEKGATEQRQTEATQEARDNRQARQAYRY